MRPHFSRLKRRISPAREKSPTTKRICGRVLYRPTCPWYRRALRQTNGRSARQVPALDGTGSATFFTGEKVKKIRALFGQPTPSCLLVRGKRPGDFHFTRISPHIDLSSIFIMSQYDFPA